MQRERIAHYRIERLLGAGGMGEVWAAFDEKLERRVAIKVLPEERASDDARARMLREARAAGALHHPGIVPVYDTGELDGVTYIVMEWLEGETVGEMLARHGPLAPAEALELVSQAADALAAAHAAGIVHRDVKTANLMIDSRGQVRVLDFGLSKRVGLSHAPTGQMAAIDPDAPTEAPDGLSLSVGTDRTLPATPAPGSSSSRSHDPVTAYGARMGTPAGTDRTLPATPAPGSSSSRSHDPVTAYGARMGTPGYAPPELLSGGLADARSDVFSLAVVLYELVTGARPFQAATWAALEDQMRKGPVAPSIASKGAVGPRFDAVVARAFAPRRADRFSTVGELVVAARDAIAPVRRGRGRWLLAGGAAIVLAAGGAAIVLAAGGGGGAPGSGPSPSPIATPAHAGPALAGPPRPLTSLGGCAEGPIFADDHTIVFDLSRNGAVDLWAVDRSGKSPRALVSTPAWEWRAAPGRIPGEVLFLHTDMDDEEKSAVIALDVATGAERARITQFASSVAAAGDAIEISVREGTDIRRRAGDRDESWTTLPPELAAQQIVTSTKSELLAFTAVTPGAPLRLCTVARGAAPTCFEPQPAGGRPEFSHDGRAIYYGTETGLRRHDLASGRDEMFLADVAAWSGVGISPDGKSLAYSECNQFARLVDVTAPAKAIVDEEFPDWPAAGPAGALAWVHEDLEGDRLMLRRTDGTITELVPPSFGRITAPSFDATGDHVAFVAGGKHPGVHVVETHASNAGAPQITQLTDGANDYSPRFTRDGRVVFTRADDRNVSHIFAVGRDGGAARQTSPASRAIRAWNPATGELMVSTGDKILWWDPITDHTSAPLDGPIAPRNVSISPNGKWMVMQTGAAGLTFWRAPTRTPQALVKIAELPADQTVEAAAIDDDGRILAPVAQWRGELTIVDAAPGATF